VESNLTKIWHCKLFSMISQWGSISKGSVLTVALALSLTILIYLSTSGTCSSLPVMRVYLPCSSIVFLTHSFLKPLPWYLLIICCSDFIIVDFVSFFSFLQCPNELLMTLTS